jgi:ribonuclease-3 family protein
MENINVDEIGILNMAFLGDAVWELHVREALCKDYTTLKNLSQKTARFVNAKFQSEVYNFVQGELSKEAFEFSKRGRNANIKTYPKSCSKKQYRESTAFEALIAYYHINGDKEKIQDIVSKYVLSENKLGDGGESTSETI